MMKTFHQLLFVILAVTICHPGIANTEPQNDDAEKRPMKEFQRGGGNGQGHQWGKGPRSKGQQKRHGHLMKRLHNAADKNQDGVLDEGEQQEFDRLVSEAKQRMHEEILARFDQDGDGKLNKEEHAKARAAGRKKMENLRKEAIERFDLDGDGELNDEERKLARESLRQRMEARAKKFDADGDGKLDDTERAAAREAMVRERGATPPPERRGFGPRRDGDAPPHQQDGTKREELRKRFDTNQDGKLDESERQQMRETIREERASNAE